MYTVRFVLFEAISRTGLYFLFSKQLFSTPSEKYFRSNSMV